MFAGPLLVAAVLEGAIALLSDRLDRRHLVVAGQAALAGALGFVAWTRSAWGLTLGLAVAGAASGVACSAGQALLLVSEPESADRTMVRWSIFAAIGDVLTPLTTAGAIALGFSYRGAMLLVGLLVALQCVASARVASGTLDPSVSIEDGDAPADATPSPEPLRAALRRAVRQPRLWAWLLTAATCTLLDELVVALATLRMQTEQGIVEALAAAAAVTFAAGSVVGSAMTDRAVDRLGSRRILVGSGIGCAFALGLVLGPRTALATCTGLFVVGVACAPHHALSLAMAYRVMPDHPGTVQALTQALVVIDLGAPVAIGVVADRWGLRVALACLVLQPIVVVACALFAGRPLSPSSKSTASP